VPDQGAASTGAKLRPRWVRWARRAAFALGLCAVLLGAFVWYALRCVAVPPALAGRSPILDARPTVDAEGRAHLGASWFLKRRGSSLLYLEGDPFTMGYANGALTAEFMEIQERSLLDTVRTAIPSRVALLATSLLVLVNNRDLSTFVPLEHQVEILGISQAGTDPFPEMGSRYNRILNYHAAHDIAHWVWDKPIVGCTAFAARGPATADGHLLVGRNFDFEAGRHFDENKVIALYKPARGLAFLSVAWPGMSGAVTGINEAKIFCSLNGAHSQDRRRLGTPVSLVVRQVMQEARTLEDAVRIIRLATVFVSDSYLVADGKTGESVVVEKTPQRSAVRGMDGDLLLQANHFESAELAGDEGNRAYMAIGTSVARRARLAELVSAGQGRLDPATAAGILRDRSGAGGKTLPPGDRTSINPMIATHSVVADVTKGVLWVSRGPHQLGAFDAYTIEGFGESAAAPLIPEDAALADGVYDALLRTRAVTGP